MRSLLGLIVGAVAGWTVGVLPWLVDGGRLQVSSAWSSIEPDETPWVALPFGEYALGLLIVSGGIGGAAGVVIPRLLRIGHHTGAIGALAGFAGALAQTWDVVGPFREETDAAVLLVVVLVAAAVTAPVLGVLAGLGIASGWRWSQVAGGTVVAAMVGSWTAPLVLAVGLDGLVHRAHWLLAPALAVVLARAGVRPVWHLLGWVVPVVVVTLAQPFFTALSYAAVYGSSGMGSGAGLRELIDSTFDVFTAASHPSTYLLAPPAVAVAAALVWSIAQTLSGRDHSGPDPVSERG